MNKREFLYRVFEADVPTRMSNATALSYFKNAIAAYGWRCQSVDVTGGDEVNGILLNRKTMTVHAERRSEGVTCIVRPLPSKLGYRELLAFRVTTLLYYIQQGMLKMNDAGMFYYTFDPQTVILEIQGAETVVPRIETIMLSAMTASEFIGRGSNSRVTIEKGMGDHDLIAVVAKTIKPFIRDARSKGEVS